MTNKAKDFQRATAEHILHLFKDKQQKRVLLADEVGLGKTIIAKEVIDKVGEWHKVDFEDDHFKVVYICSNISISQQNTQKLGIKDTLDISESRLSMQHLVIHQNAGWDHDYMQLIPLTPATSFSLKKGTGTKRERALMFIHLSRLPRLLSYRQELSEYMKMMPMGGNDWEKYVDLYQEKSDKCDSNGSNYYANMQKSLLEKLSEYDIKLLIDFCTVRKKENCSFEAKTLLNRLRHIFAEISLEQLEPDLVIMDEFQRFKSLLKSDGDCEQAMLMKKFLTTIQTKVLLLSATPYKPFTTLEELNENNTDEQYDDFLQLMDFLYEKQTGTESFKPVWRDYSLSLVNLNESSFSVVVDKKNIAEGKLYNVMCRTERFNTGIVNDSQVGAVSISEGDILSYCQMKSLMKIFDKVAIRKGGCCTKNLPMEYVKSCPYLLSFMDNYQLKKDIVNAFYHSNEDARKYVGTRSPRYILTTSRINNYQKIDSNNAKLDFLKNILFRNNSEQLLWVPASRPYYTVKNGIYEKNRAFSKVLVFSAWEMVPRMLSILLSYESERLIIPYAVKNATYQKKFSGKLIDENKPIITFVSEYLSSLYVPETSLGQDISVIRHNIKHSIEGKLNSIKKQYNIKKYAKSSAKSTLSILKILDDDIAENHIFDTEELYMAEDSAEIWTEIAISSTANVLYRILKNKRSASEVAENFISLFNNREATAIIDILYPKDDYYVGVLKYCTDGNLQAVMDEYCHLLEEKGEKLCHKLNESFADTTPTLDIDTTDSFYNKGGVKKMSMRTSYALRYGNIRFSEKDVKRSVTVRSVFNSPFRPFVLASTSVGQEGLDFHWYARKIVHWNLPSNPVDLEQREGRINRYKCLAVRRNVAHRYPNLYDWDDMFEAAEKEFRKDYSEMVPYWCLTPEMKEVMEKCGQEFEQIERIIPMYPLSRDQSRYAHLIKVLSLYRLTMGQPRQEELLQLLQDKLSEIEMEELLIDLSPSSAKHRCI